MSKTTIVIIIYIIGLILGAIFLDIWSADTNIIKGLLGLGWTALLLIGLFFIILSETTIRFISEIMFNNLFFCLMPILTVLILYLFFLKKFNTKVLSI